MFVAIATKTEVVAVSRLCRRLLAVATIVTVAILSFAIALGRLMLPILVPLRWTVRLRRGMTRTSSFRRPLPTTPILTKNCN